MAVYVRCPHCNKNQLVGRSQLDKTVLCPKCRKAYIVGVDTIYDSDDTPDPDTPKTTGKKMPTGHDYSGTAPSSGSKPLGCVTVLVWIVAIYFYLNTVMCFVLAKDDPTGAYMGGAIISFVIAVLFTVLGKKI